MIDKILLKANQEGTRLRKWLKENELGILLLTKHNKSISDFVEVMSDICGSEIEYSSVSTSFKNDLIGLAIETKTTKTFEDIKAKVEAIEGVNYFTWKSEALAELVVAFKLPDKNSVYLRIKRQE